MIQYNHFYSKVHRNVILFIRSQIWLNVIEYPFTCWNTARIVDIRKTRFTIKQSLLKVFEIFIQRISIMFFFLSFIFISYKYTGWDNKRLVIVQSIKTFCCPNQIWSRFKSIILGIFGGSSLNFWSLLFYWVEYLDSTHHLAWKGPKEINIFFWPNPFQKCNFNHSKKKLKFLYVKFRTLLIFRNELKLNQQKFISIQVKFIWT